MDIEGFTLDHARMVRVDPHPYLWLGVFGAPKSGSTFLWVALAKLLNAERVQFPLTTPEDAGDPLNFEPDAVRMYLRSREPRGLVWRSHNLASRYVLDLVDRFHVKPIVTVRGVLDSLVSLREEYLRQWSHPNIFAAIRDKGSYEGVPGTIPFPIVDRFVNASAEEQMDMTIDLACAWYSRFVLSWVNVQGAHLIRFEDMIEDEADAVRSIMMNLMRDYPREEIAELVASLKADHAEANINVGVVGRGRKTMTAKQIARVEAITRAMGGDALLEAESAAFWRQVKAARH
jgi:hypothetical protein